MPPVDPANQLAALIRVQVAELRRRQETKSKPSGQRSQPEAVASPSSPPDLGAVVAQRIRSIDAGDPQRERKALRMFLETVMLAELGQGLANDPSFAVMIDHVQAQFDGDPELAQAAHEAAQVLLKNADAAG